MARRPPLHDTREVIIFVYLFIHPYATSVALGQVSQVLKHKRNAPSQTVLQDLHKFS
jgi:hypothetical protein